MKDRKLEPTYWALDKKRENGHIILLNGVSSSGKGSIATELQKILEIPYLIFCADVFFLRKLYREREGS